MMFTLEVTAIVSGGTPAAEVELVVRMLYQHFDH